MSKKKLVVIGGGPGGYTAAFHAADLGMEVTLINENERIGGVCLLEGCIPSKALLHVAKLINEARELKGWGVDFGEPQIDINALRQWKDEVIGKLTGGLGQLNKQRGIRFVQGSARFTSPSELYVEGQDPIKFDHCIVATGSRPVVPPGLKVDSPLLMDSSAALALEEIPEHLLVVGGGYIGLEMSTVYSALGAKVTVVEMTDGLLPGVDRDLVRILQARLRKQLKQIRLKTRVNSLVEKDGMLEAHFDTSPEVESFDRVLIAVGRRPNTESLGLEAAGVRIHSTGFVQVDSNFRTASENIFAIGDVIGGAMLAHKASHEGRTVVEHILGKVTSGLGAMPAVVFTDPEIAWCGMTEEQAKAEGREVTVSKFPWGASGRATTVGRNDGASKLIIDSESGKIVGVGLVGAGAGELIAEGVLAVNLGARPEDLAHSIHPHPTLSETLMEAAEMHLGSATHVYRKPR